MKNPEVKAIIKANKSVFELFDYLVEKYHYTPDELKAIEDCKKHLLNLNIIFNKIKK